MDAWLEDLGPRLVLWAGSRISPSLRVHVSPEDVAQEVLAALFRDLLRIGPNRVEDISRWVFTVAENRIRDLAKGLNAAKRKGEAPRPPRQRTPSSIVSRREELARVIAAIDRLPPAQRDVVRLRRFERLPTSEVAQRLGRSEGAVRMLYMRAVRALEAAV